MFQELVPIHSSHRWRLLTGLLPMLCLRRLFCGQGKYRVAVYICDTASEGR